MNIEGGEERLGDGENGNIRARVEAGGGNLQRSQDEGGLSCKGGAGAVGVCESK